METTRIFILFLYFFSFNNNCSLAFIYVHCLLFFFFSFRHSPVLSFVSLSASLFPFHFEYSANFTSILGDVFFLFSIDVLFLRTFSSSTYVLLPICNLYFLLLMLFLSLFYFCLFYLCFFFYVAMLFPPYFLLTFLFLTLLLLSMFFLPLFHLRFLYLCFLTREHFTVSGTEMMVTCHLRRITN